MIAIVELGGGWAEDDVEKYFTALGQPRPAIVDVSVDGTTNSPGGAPGNPSDPDIEVAMDLQIAGASYYAATGKAASIRMYWTTDLLAGIRAATNDACDVCSISWGANEGSVSPQLVNDLEIGAAEAVGAGTIVLASTGDNDANNGGPYALNVDVPAACPHVIACGGTSRSDLTEVVWNNDPGTPSGQGTGGGYSQLFPFLSWQMGAPHGPGRMVPDVAAHADSQIGYELCIGGLFKAVGGTSAVPPLYAGLLASLGRKLGFISPALWGNQVCFTDITSGDNGYYRARLGPDACTGLGAPLGARLAARISGS